VPAGTARRWMSGSWWFATAISGRAPRLRVAATRLRYDLL
jgi:hypothetical protein